MRKSHRPIRLDDYRQSKYSPAWCIKKGGAAHNHDTTPHHTRTTKPTGDTCIDNPTLKCVSAASATPGDYYFWLAHAVMWETSRLRDLLRQPNPDIDATLGHLIDLAGIAETCLAEGLPEGYPYADARGSYTYSDGTPVALTVVDDDGTTLGHVLRPPFDTVIPGAPEWDEEEG